MKSCENCIKNELIMIMADINSEAIEHRYCVVWGVILTYPLRQECSKWTGSWEEVISNETIHA